MNSNEIPCLLLAIRHGHKISEDFLCHLTLGQQQFLKFFGLLGELLLICSA